MEACWANLSANHVGPVLHQEDPARALAMYAFETFW